jgi:aminodeoxyfutalosine deaminase
VRYETALELAALHGLPRPAPYDYSDLDGFLAVYQPVARSMQTSEDFERVIAEHARSMREQGIEYAEISFNPSLHTGEEWVGGVERGRAHARQEFEVEIAWLVELVRGDTASSNERSLDIALATNGVVGLGLVGDESAGSPGLGPLIDRAHAKGLRFMPHAGQTGGPEVVREAIDVLGADRIAHGVAALRDEAVLHLIADRAICVCVCPTSNARIGLRPDYAALAAAGIPLTVNSDDPAMVATTLTRELELAVSDYGFDREVLIANAREFAFRT